MFAYDSQLLAAVQGAPQSVDDVIRTMQAIDTICPDGDGLKWFNWLYLGVTQAVGARVDAGGFHDAAWMAALDVQFAGLYFGALRSALSGGTAPRCWRVLFERRNWTALARIQCALAGVNAHINHDLPMAIVRTGVAPVHGDAHYADYTALNATLGTLVDSAKTSLQVRLLGDLLPPVSHLEDTIAAFSMTAAREAAWNHAEMLWTVRALPRLSARMADTLDGMTAVIGKTLLVPVV
ncbi:MAG: DUF5995 family protein [Candidatus Solibacter sp.]|nr:DUF5995 family protein [Candidatus Solibacter sp.]